MTRQAQLEADAEKWREHVHYLREAANPGWLHIRMSVGIGADVLHIEKVLTLEMLEHAMAGDRKVIGDETYRMFLEMMKERWMGNPRYRLKKEEDNGN